MAMANRGNRSVEEIAQAAGLDVARVHAFEVRGARPTPPELTRLGGALGIDPLSLIVTRVGVSPLWLLRVAAGLGRREVASRVVIDEKHLERLENGLVIPADGVTQRLATVLGYRTKMVQVAASQGLRDHVVAVRDMVPGWLMPTSSRVRMASGFIGISVLSVFAWRVAVAITDGQEPPFPAWLPAILAYAGIALAISGGVIYLAIVLPKLRFWLLVSTLAATTIAVVPSRTTTGGVQAAAWLIGVTSALCFQVVAMLSLGRFGNAITLFVEETRRRGPRQAQRTVGSAFAILGLGLLLAGTDRCDESSCTGLPRFTAELFGRPSLGGLELLDEFGLLLLALGAAACLALFGREDDETGQLGSDALAAFLATVPDDAGGSVGSNDGLWLPPSVRRDFIDGAVTTHAGNGTDRAVW